MDKLFDLLNSKPITGSKDFNHPFKNTHEQREHLLKMLNIFKNMQVVETKIIDGKTELTDVTQHMEFLNGWKITINSLLQLWEDVQTPQYGLSTYRLCQVCLENLFGNFRNQNGNNVNPTPIQFLWAFMKLFCLNYFKHSEGSNCLEDLDEILTNLGDTTSPLTNAVLFLEKSPFNYSYLRLRTTEYRELDLTPKYTLTYVCGYLLKKMP